VVALALDTVQIAKRLLLLRTLTVFDLMQDVLLDLIGLFVELLSLSLL